MAKAVGLKKESDVPRFFFRVRAVQPNDAEALHDLAQRHLTTVPNILAGSHAKEVQDKVTIPTFKDLAEAAPLLELAGQITLVAEACEGHSSNEGGDAPEKLSNAAPSLPHRILGYASLSPFRRDAPFKRTAQVMMLPLLHPLLAEEDRKAIIISLVRGCVRACKEKDLHWRVLTVQVPFRENHLRWQEDVAAYQEGGFRKVGMLEKVFETEGELSSLVFLQHDL